MTKGAYYNEIDPFAAEWLRRLMIFGHIAPGEVDERSIEDVKPDDLRGFTQCHFFAGIGVWSHALRSAGWADTRPVWTGSCPCQPFSAAGKGAGFDDERHLWPAFLHLIRECRPDVVLGEQVASKDGLAWLDLVQADLEGEGYASGALDTCAAGFGAPHIRQRLYWVGASARTLADADYSGLAGRLGKDDRNGAYGEVRLQTSRHGDLRGLVRAASGAGTYDLDGGAARSLADADDTLGRADDTAGHNGVRDHAGRQEGSGDAAAGLGHGGLADADGAGPAAQRGDPGEVLGVSEREGQSDLGSVVPGRGGSESLLADASGGGRGEERSDAGGSLFGDRTEGLAAESRNGLSHCGPGPVNGLWRDADWLFCRDGRWRPVEPGTFPLAHGAAARVGRLRGYGNAINAAQAQGFIEAVMESVS